jgi:hypothetical protein
MTDLTSLDILLFFGAWELLYVLDWIGGESL